YIADARNIVKNGTAGNEKSGRDDCYRIVLAAANLDCAVKRRPPENCNPIQKKCLPAPVPILYARAMSCYRRQTLWQVRVYRIAGGMSIRVWKRLDRMTGWRSGWTGFFLDGISGFRD